MEQQKTILFVEDEPILRELTKDILEHGGYKVWLAKDGEDAIELYRKRGMEIDVVIVDMIMPVMNGERMCETIHAMNPEARILISSGYDEDIIVRRLLTDKVVKGFIQKPYKVSELIREIEKVLGT